MPRHSCSFMRRMMQRQVTPNLCFTSACLDTASGQWLYSIMDWTNQVALVTGGARGIGRATAQLLAQRGAAVCVNYAAHKEAAEALLAEIAGVGGRAIAVKADVADASAVEAMVARA